MKKFAFDVKKTVSYWVEGGEYDLGVATAMLKAKKYPYVLFMGHLALEKLIKLLSLRKRGLMRPSVIHCLIYWRGRV